MIDQNFCINIELISISKSVVVLIAPNYNKNLNEIVTMKLILLLFVAFVAVASARFSLNPKLQKIVQEKLHAKTTNKNVRAAGITERFNVQPVDHYNLTDSRTFLQRYWFNDDFYQPGGPIIIFFAGFDGVLSQAAPDNVPLESFLAFDIARESNGIVYLFENRYFGESRPTSDMSVNNFQYFTIGQSLEDYAALITRIRQELEEFGSDIVLALGHDTGSSIATWMRQLYPELVFGTWASSAPLYAKMAFPEFLTDIADTYRSHNETCYTTIQQAFQQLEELFEAGNTEEVRNIFGLSYTPDADNAVELGLFTGILANTISIWPEYFE